ncbi:Starch-binding associating with outer membrane [Lutibacter oricola]|uniref:Starch-binding associating with outer membrane n=1 Tax=Lutibacter oricola TaxID=762486 RepID=A0A1H3FGS8_9FLAO|nr:RagB/SusD family nutrient uptake outer membrane protein [Lutibacter oricola]SDX90201.1 Starch-binding associating with outer membrane [Lutibacter oricola]
MKKFISISKFLFIGMLAIMVSNCEDLDEGSEGLQSSGTFYADANTLDAGVIGIYGTLRRNNWGLDNYSHYCGADDLTSRLGSNKWVVLESDQFARTAGNSWSTNDWNGNYSTIYAANSFIQNAHPEGVDEAVINAAQANAYFIRGLCYFRLATTFGDIPMPLSPSPDFEMTLTPKREVLEQVISDFEFAIQWSDNARDTDPTVSNGRVTKTAAKAFLAKTYMQLTGYPYNETDKWANVKSLTNEIIGAGVYSLMDDFAKNFQDPHQVNKEVIHAHVMSRESWPIITQNRVYGFRWANWMDAYMEWTYYNNFPDGYRKEFSTSVDPETNQFFVEFGNPIVTKYTYATGAPNSTDPVGEVKEHTWQTSNDRIAMRYAEVLLMYAEACANTGESAEAIDKLNMVKRRAYAKGSTKQAEVEALAVEFWKTPDPMVDYTSTELNTTEKLVDAIVKERAYEFLGEVGGNRWLDLVRLDMVAEVNANRDPNDVPLIGNPADKETWWTPIPSGDVVLNPNLGN